MNSSNPYGSTARVNQMRNFKWLAVLAALALSACGGGGSDCSTSFANSCGATNTGPTVASILLVTDTPSIPSDNSANAHLTAYVSDANNNFIQGAVVQFQADKNGGVGVTQGTTDANGVATATLSTLSDKSNRTITVTATSGKITGTVTVDVTGTTIGISGSKSLTAGQSADYVVTVADSSSTGIPGVTVTVTAPSVVTVNKTSIITDSQGHATFTATGAAGGPGTISVDALGLPPATIDLSVNGDALTFTSPAALTRIALNTTKAFTAHWVQNGAPVVNQKLNFSTTRGCINPAATTCVGQPSTASVNTDASGNATVNLLSDDAGGATVTASTAGGTTVGIDAQFIATIADSIAVQPSLFTIATGNTSDITAVVRDKNNNLVTGATVVFTLTDTTGGTLSVASAVTDIQGRSSTTYTASTVASAANGVVITAKVTSTTNGGKTVTASVALTVAGANLFISIGTGNTIIANAAGTQYQKDYIVQVTDSSGAGVKGAQLSMSVLSQYYYKGYRTWTGTIWADCYTVPTDICTGGGSPTFFPTHSQGCHDEDLNRNGILDLGPPSEDNNHDGMIEAGNIALVSPSTVTADDNGFANVSVFYPEEYAYWLEVTLQAQASVQGTAFSAQSTFMLPGKSDDFSDQKKSPPGPVSPFGQSNTCTDTL